MDHTQAYEKSKLLYEYLERVELCKAKDDAIAKMIEGVLIIVDRRGNNDRRKEGV